MNADLYIGNLRIDEIQSMRRTGKTWKTIADFAGVSLSCFWKCRNAYGLNDDRRNYEKTKFQPAPLTEKVLKAVNRFGFETISDYIHSRKLEGATRQDMKSETGMTDYVIEVHTPKNMKYFWHPKRNEKNMITLAKAWLNKSKRNAVELAKRIEAKQPKGFGMFYAEAPIDPATGTGNFLKTAADDLAKGGLQNPPSALETPA